MNLQAKALRELVAERDARRAPRRTRTVAIGSAAPGVGRATLAANLAVALHGAGLRVVLIDVTLGLDRPDGVLDLEPRGTLAHVLAGRRRVSQVALDGPAGLRVVPAGLGIQQFANLTPWQQQWLWDGFAELGEATDLVLIDTPSGVGPNAVSVLAAADEAIVVAGPEPAAVAEAYALIKMIAERNPAATIRLLANRVASPHEGQGVASRIARVAQRFLGIHVHLLGTVVDDPAVAEAARRRTPFVVADPACQAARCLAAVATRLRQPAGTRPQRPLADCMRQIAAFQTHSFQAESEHAVDGKAAQS